MATGDAGGAQRGGNACAAPADATRSVGRECGSCSLCCTVLRVDPLRKLGGVDCVHQRAGGGCAIHGLPERPSLCGAYRCAWLRGAFDDEDRPDRLGAVLDWIAPGGEPALSICEARPGAFEASPRLRAIAERHRASMPVRVTCAADARAAEPVCRVLRPGGEEERVQGDRLERWRDGVQVAVERAGWAERVAHRVARAWQRWRIRGYRG